MAQAILGDVIFQVSEKTFGEISRGAKHRWAKVSKVGVRPAMQSVGPDLEEIEFSGFFHARYVGGMDHVKNLRALTKSREPVVFTCSWDKINENLGLWCVESVEESRKVIYRDGVPGRVDFTVRLIEYGGSK